MLVDAVPSFATEAIKVGFGRSAAFCTPLPTAEQTQATADLADAEARSRARGCPLALSDDDAGLIGIG